MLLGIEHHLPARSGHSTDRTPILEAEPEQNLIKAGLKL